MRPFTVVDASQRSAAWFASRCGRLTASLAKDMLATVKSGEAAARRDLRVRLVVERLTQRPEENGYTNEWMQRGIDLEPVALAAFEALTGDVVSRVGFLAHTELMAGGSPDGVIGDFEGLVELKAPKSATQIGYLRGPKVAPPEHLAQLTHLLWLTGCAYIDFFSFDDRLPPHLQSFLVRVERDQVDLAAYDAKVKQFLDEVDRELSVLQGWHALEATA